MILYSLLGLNLALSIWIISQLKKPHLRLSRQLFYGQKEFYKEVINGLKKVNEPEPIDNDDDFFEKLSKMSTTQLRRYIIENDPRIERHLPLSVQLDYFDQLYQTALLDRAVYLNRIVIKPTN